MFEMQLVRGLTVYTNRNASQQAFPAQPTVVMLHGYGANGQDLIPCADFFSKGKDWRWIFPEASKSLGGYGNFKSCAWFDIDVMAYQQAAAQGTDIFFSAKTLNEAEACVQKLLKVFAELQIDPAHTILSGFSQGSMLALMLATAFDLPIAGLMLFSCADVLNNEVFQNRIASRAGRFKIFQSHGRADPVLAFESGESLRNKLQNVGFEVEFREFSGGHELPQLVLQNADRWAKKRLE